MEIRNFQDFILALTNYWTNQGCMWSQPYDFPMGAGTFHPHTFLRGIGPEPWRAVYVQPCRRPVDGRYGKSPYRFQHYYQLQVLLKPAPANIVDVFLRSLESVGIKLQENDISLLEDDWKGPTLGAWGLGWEVRANGQEVTQFTYFQQLGGLDVEVVSGEITYGLERLYMYAKGLNNALEIPFNDSFTYGDIYYQNEYEFSFFNFKDADTAQLFAFFDTCEKNVFDLCEKKLVLPAYDFVLSASHSFNLLDARGAISVSERQRFIGRVRECARKCAELYREERERLGFPILKRQEAAGIVANKVTAVPSVGMSETASKTTKGASESSILFELGVEEMPPGFQVAALEQLKTKNADFWTAMKAKFQNNTSLVQLFDKVTCEIFVSARRLGVLFSNVPESEPDQQSEVWGPAERIAKTPEGKLTPAGEGFCRKNGIDPSQVVFKQKSDGTFLYAEKSVMGQKFTELLATEFKKWVEEIPAPLKMKWQPESVSGPFIRPVRWAVALKNSDIIPAQFFGLTAGRTTSGQRILTPDFYPIDDAKKYSSVLRELSVEPNWQNRRDLIVREANRVAATVKGRIRADDGLFDKCTGLIENPVVFVGNMDEKYLALPDRLVTSVLREHMNYFTVEDTNGNLLPYYVGVAGYKCKKEKEMIEGTRTVVTGRLEDGTFYYETDLGTPIADMRERLKNQLFQANMGTLWDKTHRTAHLAVALAEELQGRTKETGAIPSGKVMRLAGEFCKADLKSGCVQEFPDEMQGVMGGVLIRHQKPFGGDSEVVAHAVAEHYQPAGANSPLPTTVAGRLLSLADKLDSLAMFINGGADVKGNKDPFGLRRNAIGVLRLLGLNEGEVGALPYSLDEILGLAIKTLSENGVTVVKDLSEKIRNFMLGRLRAAWRDQYDPGVVEAVCTKLSNMTLQDARSLIKVTTDALQKKGAGSLADALIPYKRCKNLTQSLPAGVSAETLDPKVFVAPQEKVLFEKLSQIESRAEELTAKKRYSDFVSLLAEIGAPLAAFFDAVMVNDPNEGLKRNRLALLLRVRKVYEGIADFSLVQVG